MQEVDNVLRIFEETRKALKENNSLRLKELSNQTINTASRTHDPDNIATAVIVYSLGKIIERPNYRADKGWNDFYKSVLMSIERIIKCIRNKDEKGFKTYLGMIRKSINKFSSKLKKYIEDVFRKASINKASKIYEHGISMEKTAKLLGVTMFDLASYAGQTEISDTKENKTLDVRARVKLAMEMFE